MPGTRILNPTTNPTIIENDETTNFLEFESTPPTAGPSTTTMVQDKYSRAKVHRDARTLLEHITTATHASVLLFLILITYYCFSNDFQFFTWHPLLLSFGWMFLMIEAVLSISQENLFTGTLPKNIRVRLHWICQAIALTFISIGFVIVYINKNNLNKEHFKTWHSFLGFIAMLCTIPSAMIGAAALFSVSLRHYITPKILKFLHITTGIITLTFGGMALILSVYTNWFAKHSNENVVTFVLGLIFVSTAVLGTLIRPVITWYNHI